MPKDIPYSVIKQDSRAYEIMLLRDQYANTFSDIAEEKGISVAKVMRIYNRVKMKQIRLYINHIAVALGYENALKIREIYDAAYECYQEWAYACAYLEKKYRDILIDYREGEPGAPTKFIRSMPPFKLRLSKKTVARVIELREIEKASFVSIAQELHITRAKAKHTYQMFYHQKVLKVVEALEERAQSNREKTAIRDYCFKGCKSSKERYELLTKGRSDETQHESPVPSTVFVNPRG